MRLAVTALFSLLLFQQASGGLCRAEGSSSTGDTEENLSSPEALGHAVELGEAALKRGEYRKALGYFRDADAVDFPETPHYEVLPKIAEASCRLGDLATGQAIVADLRCILDVESGVTPCYVGEETQGAPGHPNPRLTPVCFERMCGEIFLAYYESPSETVMAEVAVLRGEIDRLAQLCGNESTR